MGKLFGVIVLVLVIFSCKPKKTSLGGTAELASNGSSVISGTIIEVSDDRSLKFPCSEAPCFADVRIDSVIAQNGMIQTHLFAKQQIKMRFVFTLNETTTNLFPNLKRTFPGLEVGDKFKANIREETLLGAGNHQIVVYDYILLN